MLSVEAVTVRYGHIAALREVSFDVGNGQIVALLGANGAGKTTVLRAITGLAPVSAGTIRFDGASITGRTPETLAAQGIAHIPQGRGVFPRMTISQNLAMGGYARRLGRADLASAIDDALARFPALQRRLGQRAGTLSGGEQQMLAIARTLIGRPKLLLIDEPSHGLAPRLVAEVFDLLAELRANGVTILVVEQFASVALGVADHAVLLDRGTVALSASPDAVDRERLAGTYLGAAR